MTPNLPSLDDVLVTRSSPRKRLSDNLVPMRRQPDSPSQGSENRLENELAELCRSLEKQLNEKTTALNAAKQHADRVAEDLQVFVTAVSHDLRAPLRSIAGFSNFLSQEYSEVLDDTAKDYIDRIVGGATRLRTQIDSITQYARVYTAESEFSNVNLNEVIECVTDELNESIVQSEAKVTWERLPCVLGDQVQLTQLVRHLIANSIQFRGNAAPQIHLSARQQDGTCSVEVRDNGMGIEQSKMDAAFRMFRCLDHQPKDSGGTGAGLAICKRIVERHGGTIEMQSELGVGTSVIFSLTSHDPTA